MNEIRISQIEKMNFENEILRYRFKIKRPVSEIKFNQCKEISSYDRIKDTVTKIKYCECKIKFPEAEIKFRKSEIKFTET